MNETEKRNLSFRVYKISGTLKYKVLPFQLLLPGGTVLVYRGGSGTTTASATRYVTVNSSGTLSLATSITPATFANGTVAVIGHLVANASQITDVVNYQAPLTSAPAYSKYVHTAAALTTAGQDIVGVDSTLAVTVTLATADVIAGKVIRVRDEEGNADNANITIATEGDETIDGSATATISAASGSITLYSDGTNWFSCN